MVASFAGGYAVTEPARQQADALEDAARAQESAAERTAERYIQSAEDIASEQRQLSRDIFGRQEQLAHNLVGRQSGLNQDVAQAQLGINADTTNALLNQNNQYAQAGLSLSQPYADQGYYASTAIGRVLGLPDTGRSQVSLGSPAQVSAPGVPTPTALPAPSGLASLGVRSQPTTTNRQVGTAPPTVNTGGGAYRPTAGGDMRPQPASGDQYATYVQQNPDILRAYEQQVRGPSGGQFYINRGADLDGDGTVSLSEFGQDHYRFAGEREGRALPGQTPTAAPAPANSKTPATSVPTVVQSGPAATRSTTEPSQMAGFDPVSAFENSAYYRGAELAQGFDEEAIGNSTASRGNFFSGAGELARARAGQENYQAGFDRYMAQLNRTADTGAAERYQQQNILSGLAGAQGNALSNLGNVNSAVLGNYAANQAGAANGYAGVLGGALSSLGAQQNAALGNQGAAIGGALNNLGAAQQNSALLQGQARAGLWDSYGSLAGAALGGLGSFARGGF